MTSDEGDSGDRSEGAALARNRSRRSKNDRKRANKPGQSSSSHGEVAWAKGACAHQATIDWRLVLAIVGHELRNPLNSIQAGLKSLRLGPSAMEAQRAIELMKRQVALAARLVGDLIDLSQGSTGKIALAQSSTTLSEILELSLATCRPRVSKAGQSLKESLQNGDLTFVADPARLTQALTNLLENAVKFTPRGGLITILADVTESEVFVTVSDTGAGIKAEDLGLLCTPFTQIARSRAQSPHGLGLGLFIVKSIAEAHGGLLTAHSAGESMGSSFTIRVPRTFG